MKTNPWTFGIIFLVLAGFWMYSNFTIPKFYPFETTGFAKGVVYKIDALRPHLPKGGGMDQAAYFIFKIKDSIYVKETRLHKGNQFAKIGDSLLIEYSVKNPNRNKVLYNLNIAPLDLYNHQFKTNFSAVKENGYKELSLNAHIFTYADYGDYGKLLLKTSGTFSISHDTIILQPLVQHKFDKTKYHHVDILPVYHNNIKLSKFLMHKEAKLTEIETDLILK